MSFGESFVDGLSGGITFGPLVGIVIGIIKLLAGKSGTDNSNPCTTCGNNQPSSHYQSPSKAQSKAEATEGVGALTQMVALQAIEKMADLKRQGILTAEEFEEKKTELLKRV